MVAVGAVLVLGIAAVALGLMTALVTPTPLVGFGVGQRQRAESAVYAVGWLLGVPLAVLVGPRLADRLEARRPGTASTVAALAVAVLAAGVLLLRLATALADRSPDGLLLVVVVVWALATAGVVAVVVRGRLPTWAGPASWWAAAAGVAGCVVALTNAYAGVQALPLVGGALVAAGVLVAYARLRPGPPGRRAGVALDLVAALLVLGLCCDLVVIRPDAPGLGGAEAFLDQVVVFHQDFLLGPVTQVLHGTPVLDGAASQYGVGVLYFIAGFSWLVGGAGHGTIGLLDGLLVTGCYVGALAIVRMAGVPRTLAYGALGVAVAVLVLGLDFPVGTIVQEGPLRFGLPLAMLVWLVAAERRGRPGGLPGLWPAVAGASAIWSLEAWLYTTIVVAGVVLAQVLVRPERRRAVLRGVAVRLVAAWVVAHVVLVLGTVAQDGHLPHYGQYLDYLHAFLAGGLGDLTYDVRPWSPVLGVGAAELVSAAATGIVLLRRPDLARREHVAVVALAGTTAWSACLLYYFVDRSAPHVLPYTCLPVVVAGLLWAGIVARSEAGRRRAPAALGALAVALVVAVATVTAAWPTLGARLERTALWHAAPGAPGLRDAVHRLRRFPPAQASTPAGVAMLRRWMPGESRSLVLVDAGLDVDVLLQADRGNLLPLGYPVEDLFVLGSKQRLVAEAVARLRPGRRMLTDRLSLAAMRTPLAAQPTAADLAARPTILQREALQAIARRFRLRELAADPQGFVVVQLEPR